MSENQNHKCEITTQTIAELYIKQGYPDKAIDIYKAILELDPDNETASMKLREVQTGITASQDAMSPENVVADKSKSNSMEAQISKLEEWLSAVRMIRKGGI